MKYAILCKPSGQLMDYCDSIEQARWFIDQPEFELVEIANASKVEVIYTELSGPNGYGHQESSFITYGGLTTCIQRLIYWIQETFRTFGPDPRDVRDFFRHCSLYINGEDKTQWFRNQTVEKINTKTLYI